MGEPAEVVVELFPCELCNLRPFRSQKALRVHATKSHPDGRLPTEKLCSLCEETKPLVAFRRDSRRPIGVVWACKDCERAYNLRLYHEKGDLHAAEKRARYAADPEHARLIHQIWRYANEDSHRRRSRDWWLRNAYGLSSDEYEALYEVQDGACAVCDRHFGVLHVDHNHVTKEIRGLLCGNCNRMLGMVREDPEVLRRAAEYLEASS